MPRGIRREFVGVVTNSTVTYSYSVWVNVISDDVLEVIYGL